MPTEPTPCHGPNSRTITCECRRIHRWSRGARGRVEYRCLYCGRLHIRGPRPVYDTGPVGHGMIASGGKRRPPCEGIKDE